MSKTYHFITGLPRSGSTLLSAILKQNPRFHASITDSLATMVKGIIETSQHGPGMKSEVPVERRINTVKGVFDGFYKHIDKEVVFNTNRAWTYLTPQLKELYPKSRLIVCVRDINWILDSFEVIFRKNPMTVTSVTGGIDGSVYSRIEQLMDEKGIVGFPYIGIKQAITSNEKSNLMLIEYNTLCKSPEMVIKALYSFLDEPFFQHDFNDVESSWDEYDAEIGAKIHDVSKRIEYKERTTIIPPDIWQKYSNMEVWREI